MIGTLNIHLVEGNLTHDVEWIGKQDPYCVFEFPDQPKTKSKTCTDQGKTPVWENEFYDFHVKAIYQDFQMSILDSGPFRDRTIGKATLSVKDLIKDGGVDEWIEIFYTEKKKE